jgi:acyl-CoA dehydrogenase
MDFSFTPEQERIREAVTKLCAQFGDEYWLKKDREGGFPTEVHAALANDGWLGIAMPEEYGGAGLGITEAAIMMQAIAESGGGFSARRGAHEHLRPEPGRGFGTAEQKKRMLPR